MTSIKSIADTNEFREPATTPGAPKKRIIIKAIGVGGGGNNAISHMYAQGIEDVSFVVCNTDEQALKNSPVPSKVLLGPNTTLGLGAGNDPKLAAAAAEESTAEINEMFNDDTRMVFITAGMGGGTGTGAGPVVARLAKERGLLTIGIVTIPFLFEGEKKILKALDGADEMAKYVDALLVINNERLTEIYSDLDFINAFGKADDTLSTAARSIAEIITCDGHINLDFNDVNTTLRDGGAAIISTGYGEGENRVTKAILNALDSPLLKNRDIYGSKKLLFNIYFSRKAKNSFKMSEASELTKFMVDIDKHVDVIWGVAFDDSLGEQVKITILAAGFDVTIRDDEQGLDQRSTINFPGRKAADSAPAASSKTNQSRIEDHYHDARNKLIGSQLREKYVVLTPNQFDDDEVIERMEKSAPYNRDQKVAEEIKRSSATPTPAAPAGNASRRPSTPSNIIDFTDLQ